MTRKQALVLILIGIGALAFKENVEWPERFWERPQFRIVPAELFLQKMTEPSPILQEDERDEKKDRKEEMHE